MADDDKVVADPTADLRVLLDSVALADSLICVLERCQNCPTVVGVVDILQGDGVDFSVCFCDSNPPSDGVVAIRQLAVELVVAVAGGDVGRPQTVAAAGWARPAGSVNRN